MCHQLSLQEIVISKLQSQISYGMRARYDEKIKEQDAKNPLLENSDYYK